MPIRPVYDPTIQAIAAHEDEPAEAVVNWAATISDDDWQKIRYLVIHWPEWAEWQAFCVYMASDE